jgi:hypothetical protein
MNHSAVDFFFFILKAIPNFDFFSSSFLQRTLCSGELIHDVIRCVVCLSCL